MASPERSFFFTVTPPTGNTPQKPLRSGDPDDENVSSSSLTPDSIAWRRRQGEHLHLQRPTIHIPSSISRTLSSLTTQSSETHLAQESQENTQQPTEAPIQEQQEQPNEQPRSFGLHKDFESLPAPGVQGREPGLTPENLAELNRTMSTYRPPFLVYLPSTSAQVTTLSPTGASMPFHREGAAHCLPSTIGHSRLRYYRDVRCLPHTPWAIKEGSLVIGIDPSCVECPPHQSTSTPDTHELKLGKTYVICRMYTDMWALCIEVSLDFPPPLDSWPPLGVTVGFLPLCAVTLPVNFASFLERCEARRNTPEEFASRPSTGEIVNAPQRHASSRASFKILNQQQKKKSLDITVPRMVQDIFDNFLSLRRDDGDFVVYGSTFRERLRDKIPWRFMRRGRWGLRMPKRPPIRFKLPGPFMTDNPRLRENNNLPTMSCSNMAPQLSLYRYPPVTEPEQSFLRKVIIRVFHC